MAYQTITEADGDKYRIHRFLNESGDEVVRLEIKKVDYPDFEVLFEGIIRYIVPNQF